MAGLPARPSEGPPDRCAARRRSARTGGDAFFRVEPAADLRQSEFCDALGDLRPFRGRLAAAVMAARIAPARPVAGSAPVAAALPADGWKLSAYGVVLWPDSAAHTLGRLMLSLHLKGTCGRGKAPQRGADPLPEF